MYMSKPGINIKTIFIVTSVNKFTVPPLRTLRIHERKTCLPIEKPGGCRGIETTGKIRQINVTENILFY